MNPTGAFVGVACGDPVVLEGQREPEATARKSLFQRPVQRSADVVALRDDELVAHRPRSLDEKVRRARELRQVVEEARSQFVSFAARLEQLACELPDRLQHPEAAALPAAEQALLEQRLERVEVGLAHLLGRLDREAAGEDGEAAEQLLFRLVKELVAPLDRRAQRPLALRRVSSAAREDRQRALEALEQLVGREQARARRGELDRKREPVQAA